MAYTLNRRNFFMLAAGFLAGIHSGPGYAARLFGSRCFEKRLVQLIVSDIYAARAIGQVYLFDNPDEKDADRLVRLIFPDNSIPVDNGDILSETALLATARKMIQQDFVAGNTITLDGWVLSRTETRLCALCSLL